MAGTSGSGDGTFIEAFDSDSDENFEAGEIELGEQCDRQAANDSMFARGSDGEIDFDVSDVETSIEPTDVDDDTDIYSIEGDTDSDSSGRRTRGRQRTNKLLNPPDIRFVDAAHVGVDDSEQRVDMLFVLYFTDYLLRDIVDETNKYTGQCRQKAPKKGRKHLNWDNIPVPELKTWLGLILGMGIVQKKGRLATYWSTHWLTQTPGFGQTMMAQHFMQILRFLHFVNNESTHTNKLWKIQGLLGYINKRFRTVYTPRRELSIDETMLKFKGRLKIKQCVKIKPVKWGIKLLTLAEAKTGYVVNILPYAGRRPDTDVGKTTQTVLDVCQPYLNKGHRVFMDNYYTSVELMEKLAEKRTLSCGTVKSNRVGLPADMKKACTSIKQLKRGES